jgi:hypothetical protein
MSEKKELRKVLGPNWHKNVEGYIKRVSKTILMDYSIIMHDPSNIW